MPSHIGRISRILRYPVKSMAGEQLSAAELDWQGMEGDRQFSFYRKADRSRFPWLSGRDLADLVRFSARYRDPEAPRASPVLIGTPEGECIDLGDPGLLERLSDAAGCALGLLQNARGLYDSMPISVTTTATHKRLDATYGGPLDVRRFRTNLIVESDVSESEWRGRRLTIGDAPDAAALLVADGIPRCAFVTIDPDTAEREPPIMRMVAGQFDNQVGVYASPARPGTIKVGDPAYVSG